MYLHATCLPHYPSSVIYSSYLMLFGKLRKCNRFIIRSCLWRFYQQMMLSIQILFTDYAIITDFLNLNFCSQHFISIKHRILAIFNTNKKFNSDSLYAFKIEKLQNRNIIIIYHSLTFCFIISHLILGGRRGGDRMVVGFTTAYAISAYHH